MARRARSLLVVAFALSLGSLGLFPKEAHARAGRVGQVPNGDAFSCLLCHENAGGGERTVFGRDVEDTLNGSGVAATVNWPAVCVLDSDGDGQTNGEELGDPCCVWMQGETPHRSTDLGDPNDNGSTANDPGSDACDVVDAGPPVDAGETGDAGEEPPADAGGDPPVDDDAGAPEDDAGIVDDDAGPAGPDAGDPTDPGQAGCACSPTIGEPSALMLPLFGLLLAWAIRRRRSA